VLEGQPALGSMANGGSDMIGKIPRRASQLAAVALAVGTTCALTAGAASAASEVVYNYLPAAKPGNVVSEAFEATQTSEFGGQVELAGTARKNPKVSVMMSSWACESGSWFSFDCKTEAGKKFNWPITFNIYGVGPSNTVGPILASGSSTFKIPYRPSANVTKCTGKNTGAWFSKGVCYNGKAVKLSLALKAASLPSKVIITIAFNTSDYGSTPQRPQPCNSKPEGCPYDALNVGVNDGFEEPTRTPSVGSLPLPEEAYTNGSLEGGWEGFQPLFEVSAS
jgi:hypothetical protein